MGVPWKKLLGAAKAVGSIFLPGIVMTSINAIEENVGDLMTGADKKTAVLGIAANTVSTIEGALEKDVVNDAAVVSATGNFIDAYVALMNAIAAAKAAKLPPAPPQ